MKQKHYIRTKKTLILPLFALVVIAVAFISSLPHGTPLDPSDLSLADPRSLRRLILGKPLTAPIQESYGEFHGMIVRLPAISSLTKTSRVLGLLSGPAQKRIEVDLSTQKVYAFEGDTKVYEFTVSTGKWFPTPTGEFTVWAKVRSQKMEGGDPTIGTYYNLPNVPYVMFFSNNETAKMRGFSFHGAYWHNNFGHPMSHGCVNMKIEDAHALYDWANPNVINIKAWSTLTSNENPGTKIIIYGETPKV